MGAEILNFIDCWSGLGVRCCWLTISRHDIVQSIFLPKQYRFTILILRAAARRLAVVRTACGWVKGKAVAPGPH